MTYPDPDDARNMKSGSDYELAMHWRAIALQERERARKWEWIARAVADDWYTAEHVRTNFTHFEMLYETEQST